MIVQTQRILYWLFFFWILLIGIVALVLAMYTFMPAPSLPGEIPTNSYFFNHGQAGDHTAILETSNYLRVILASGGSFIVSLSAAIVLLRFFRHDASPQMLFFFVFLLSLSFETLKLYVPLSKASTANEGLLLLLSQLSLGGYLVGLFSLFLMSLYQMQYQHPGSILLFITLLAGGIVFLVPMNTLELSQNFIYSPAYQEQILWMVRGVIIVTLIGYLFPSQFTRGNFTRITSVMLPITGQGILHFSQSTITSLIGGIMVICGLLICFRRIFRDSV